MLPIMHLLGRCAHVMKMMLGGGMGSSYVQQQMMQKQYSTITLYPTGPWTRMTSVLDAPNPESLGHNTIDI